MSKPILTWPDQRLTALCARVDDPGLAARVEAELFDALQESHRGLAAPQIGRLLRMFVIRGFPRAFVNPRLTLSEETALGMERCLSLPGEEVEVRRAVKVKVKAMTADLAPESLRTFKLRGWDARVAQHENDHLDGKLITDYAR